MKIFDQIQMCLRNLFRRKVRTMLTVMGVVVGTCSIVVMISLGVGMSENQQKALESMGDLTLLEIYNYSRSADAPKLDDSAMEAILNIPGVEVATPYFYYHDISTNVTAGKNGRYEAYGNIVGIYPESLEKMGFELLEGRLIKENDTEFSVLFGEKTVYEFRDTKRKRGNDMIDSWVPDDQELPDPFFDPLKEQLTIKIQPSKENAKVIEQKLNVVGRLKQDYKKGYETARGIYMSITDFKKLVALYNKENSIKKKDDTGYERAVVKATDISVVPDIEKAIKALGFTEVQSMESIRGPMEEQSKQTQLILGGLGGISLLVAAIGITNTMVMSIYERTREIGVMKVLGCYVGNIRSVFLMEAGTIGFLGGVTGVVFSYIISYILNTVGSGALGGLLGGGMMGGTESGADISVIPLWLVALGLVFATLIGLVSGFYPANRAVKISALEAIKHE